MSRSVFEALSTTLRGATRLAHGDTQTPRPTPLVKSIIESKTTVRTSGTTYDNRAHLAPQFFDSVVAKYEGTRLGRQELNAELLEVLEGVWFGTFDPSRHVDESAEFDSSLPVRIAIDAGTSRHTGAVLYQARQIDRHRTRITVFADYYAVDLYSEPNATAINSLFRSLCPLVVAPERVRLDPASTARTGVGPAAFGEYQRVFGDRRTGWWPVHQVADGLDQIEILLGSESREPDLIIHPRCKHLIEAFNSYVRANQRGVWLPWPEDPQHPHEDLMDALRGGIRDTLPEGRKPQPALGRVQGRKVF